MDLSLCWLLLLWSTGSRVHGLQQLQNMGSVVVAPQLWSTGWIVWCTDLVPPWHVGSSQIRDQSHVSCIGKWIIYHWATREAPQFSSVQFSHSVVSDSLWPHESQHARPPCPSPTPRVHSDSHPSSQWCHLAISSSVIPFSSCPQSLQASESFPMNQLFA